MASPQKENGFTPIANEILDHLVNIPLLGAEFQILYFLIRKTYGYHKKEDVISLSQFQKATGISRPTVVKTIKNLEIRKMLVKTSLPGSRISFRFNKDYESWVVKAPKLVKEKWVTSKGVLTETSKGPLTHKRKKDNTKEIREAEQAPQEEIVSLINLFKEVNPTYSKWYRNTTQRSACSRLLTLHGLPRLERVVAILPRSNKLPYAPTITTPLQLEDKWASLEAFLTKKKVEIQAKKTIIV